MSYQEDVILPSQGEGPTKESHPIFSQDPSKWIKFLHTQVCVFTEDGKEHCGWVYTVDPVSESVVLIEHPDETLNELKTVSMKLLIGSSITKIDSVSSKPSEKIKVFCDYLFRPKSSVSLTQEEVLNRRAKLKSWLEKHRLPVSIGGHDGQSLVVADVLIIQSPFSEDNCLSTNEIILSKIQSLIKNMPDDHNS